MKHALAFAWLIAAAWAGSNTAIAGRDGAQLLHHTQTIEEVKAANGLVGIPANRIVFPFVDSRRTPPNFR